MQSNALVNVANMQGNTALHEAVRGGHQAVVELLLRSGASPSLRNKRQRTPLDCAYEFGGKVVPHTHNTQIKMNARQKIRATLTLGSHNTFYLYLVCLFQHSRLPYIVKHKNRHNIEIHSRIKYEIRFKKTVQLQIKGGFLK